jgi:hypothetical protein
MTLEFVEFIFTDVLFITFFVVLGIKALLLRRLSALGKAMAWQTASFAIAYFCAFLSVFFAAFRSDWWLWGVRVVLMITSLMVLWELKIAFGGWKMMLGEAWDSLVSLVIWWK